MIDRYKLNQFYQGEGSEIIYSNFQDLNDDVYDAENLQIVSLPMDFPKGTTESNRKDIERKWIDILPKLKQVRSLSVRHRVKQDFFEAICQMTNLERLFIWSSTVEDISNISNLAKLEKLKLWSFTRLVDISPLLQLKTLSIISIENCFKIENFEVLGKIAGLVGLQLCGDTFAPRNLRLNSLKPLTTLKNLKHLDLSNASVIDKSYECILEMENLERFDIVVTIPKEIREKIKLNHKNLKAGFFMDYDFEKKEFYNGKKW